MNFPNPLTVADKLSLILGGLARAVAAQSDPRRPGGPLAAWLLMLVWTRVMRTQTRILRLLALFQDGRLRVMTPKRAVTVGPGPTRPARAGRTRAGAKGVPLKLSWLLPLVPCAAANFACQLRLALAEPEMVALLRACPQARRVLAPLCRMIGIEAELLSPPPARPMDAAEVAAVAARVATDEVWARAYNLGVVRRFAADAGPPGNGGWRFGEPP